MRVEERREEVHAAMPRLDISDVAKAMQIHQVRQVDDFRYAKSDEVEAGVLKEALVKRKPQLHHWACMLPTSELLILRSQFGVVLFFWTGAVQNVKPSGHSRMSGW